MLLKSNLIWFQIGILYIHSNTVEATTVGKTNLHHEVEKHKYRYTVEIASIDYAYSEAQSIQRKRENRTYLPLLCLSPSSTLQETLNLLYPDKIPEF